MNDDQNSGRSQQSDDQFEEDLKVIQGQLLEEKDAQGNDSKDDSRFKSAVRVLEMLREWKRDPQATTLGPSSEAAKLKRIGRFNVIETIGRGGCGIVVKAYDAKLDRQVALKVPRLDTSLLADTKERFFREAKLAAGLNHPGIVSVFEAGSHAEIQFIVSEFVDGENLAELCARGKRFPPTLIAECLIRLAEAIDYANESGIVHRDLKPSNVLVRGTDLLTAKITDFGLATNMDQPDLTRTGAALGTPAFMSPEQAKGQRDQLNARTDVYGLGVILYQLLTGNPPFSGESIIQTVQSVVTDPPTPPRVFNPTCPRDLEAICLKCLEKNPERRYASSALLAADLQRFLAGRQTVARTPIWFARVWRLIRRYPLQAILLAVLAALAVIGPVVANRQRGLASRAIASEQELQRLLYVSDINLAIRQWNDSNVQRCGELLRRHAPENGSEDYRGFEWYYLWDQWTRTEKADPVFADEQVESLAISDDGTLLAIGLYDGVVVLLDLPEATERARWKTHNLRNVCLSFSRDGQQLATVNGYQQTRVWDVDSQELVNEFTGDWTVDFARDADVMSFRSLRDIAIVRRACVVDGAAIDWIKDAHQSNVNAVALSSDGQSVASVGTSDGCKIWDTETLELVDSIDTGFQPWSVCWSGDGRYLALGGGAGHLAIWSRAKRDFTFNGLAHRSTVMSLGFSRDDTKLVTASTDNTCKTWSIPDGELLATLRGHSGEVKSVAFDSTGQFIFSAAIDGQVRRWDLLNQPQDVCYHPSGALGVSISADGALVASSCLDGNIRIWSTDACELVNTIAADSEAVFSCHFVSFESQRLISYGNDGKVKIWDPLQGTLVKQLDARKGAGDSLPLAVSGDGRWIAYPKSPERIEIYDRSNDQFESLAISHVGALAFAPDPKYLALTYNNRVALWDWQRQQILADLEVDSRASQYLTFSPDGKSLAVAGFDRTIKLYSTEQLIDQPSDAVPRVLRGSAAIALALDFSPDASTLVSGGDDQRIRLWDVGTGLERCTIPGHRGGITSVQFSADGTSLVTASYDGTVRIWNAPGADGRESKWEHLKVP